MLARIQRVNGRHIAMITNPTKTNNKFFSKLTINIDLPQMFTVATKNNLMITTCQEISLSVRTGSPYASLGSAIKAGMCSYQRNENATQV